MTAERESMTLQEMDAPALGVEERSLLLVAACGLPLALGCRRLWRLSYRRAAWLAGLGLGAVTVAASLMAGLLGPVATAVYAAVLSVPVWMRGIGSCVGGKRS